MQYRLGNIAPTLLGTGHFIAPNAIAVGNVILHADSSVWFGAVLRGDNEPITLGEGSNVQDLCLLHTDMGAPLTIGRDCTVGHSVTLHSCVIGDGTLIGMGATVLSRAVIGRECLIGAGSLITEGKAIPDRSLVVGSPGRVIRTLNDDEVANIRRSATAYVENANRYLRTMAPV